MGAGALLVWASLMAFGQEEYVPNPHRVSATETTRVYDLGVHHVRDRISRSLKRSTGGNASWVQCGERKGYDRSGNPLSVVCMQAHFDAAILPPKQRDGVSGKRIDGLSGTVVIERTAFHETTVVMTPDDSAKTAKVIPKFLERLDYALQEGGDGWDRLAGLTFNEEPLLVDAAFEASVAKWLKGEPDDCRRTVDWILKSPYAEDAVVKAATQARAPCGHEAVVGWLSSGKTPDVLVEGFLAAANTELTLDEVENLIVKIGRLPEAVRASAGLDALVTRRETLTAKREAEQAAAKAALERFATYLGEPVMVVLGGGAPPDLEAMFRPQLEALATQYGLRGLGVTYEFNGVDAFGSPDVDITVVAEVVDCDLQRPKMKPPVWSLTTPADWLMMEHAFNFYMYDTPYRTISTGTTTFKLSNASGLVLTAVGERGRETHVFRLGNKRLDMNPDWNGIPGWLSGSSVRQLKDWAARMVGCPTAP